MGSHAGTIVLGRSEYASESGRQAACSLWRTKKRTRGPRFNPGSRYDKKGEVIRPLLVVAGPGIEPGTS